MSRLLPLALILLALIGAGLYIFALPLAAEKAADETVRAAGFPDFHHGETQRKFGRLVFRDVSFDKSGQNKAASLSFEYDPVSLILSKQVKTVSIEEGRATFVSPIIGTVLLRFDGQLRRRKDGNASFQGTLGADQENLNLDADLKAVIRPAGAWEATLDINQARVDLARLKAARINGKVELKGYKFEPARFSGQLQAGAANFDGLPWQGVALALRGTPAQFGVSANAASIGVDGLYPELRLIYAEGAQDFELKMPMKSLDVLRDYLREHNYITREAKIPSPGKALFVFKKIIGGRYSYQVTDETGLTIRMGQVDMDWSKSLKENLQPFLAELED